ncbi:MAG TPA: hypothetical protein VJ719_00470 [Chthoniobacterales bacterium]|nr:hypothetical protein [Chthoniobacterales bacterium]
MIRTIVFILAFGVCIDAVWAKDERSIKKLRDALVALAPDVDPREAELISITAHTVSRSLAREYGVGWNAGFHNMLINTGQRERGYCGHYTRDIGQRLKQLKPRTLVLHWGAAYAKTSAENNGLVVTARNQGFADGILLDGWRCAGQLFWCPVKHDIVYRRNWTPFVQRSPDGRKLDNSSAWQEDLHYTAWLQDYENVYKWQWQPRWAGGRRAQNLTTIAPAPPRLVHTLPARP